MLLVSWIRWRRVAAAVRTGSPLEDGRELNILRRVERVSGFAKPLALVSTDASMEPGVFGILEPVLLWPRSISERMADGQLEAIFAHELAHVRRRDNFGAALHLSVQIVFWFHPMVWWIGSRLTDERERAVDEEVVQSGRDPQEYAESILKACQFYVESSFVCVAGINGSDLKQRIERIMTNRDRDSLTSWRKVLLLGAGFVMVAGPVAVGDRQL